LNCEYRVVVLRCEEGGEEHPLAVHVTICLSFLLTSES
jgi:hypothetical protein